MTQNKTALQEALENNEIYTHHADVQDSYLIIHKAAQAYADLPEKIEAMKRETAFMREDLLATRNKALDDIINMLKEG